MSTQYKKAAAAVEEVSGTFGTLKVQHLLAPDAFPGDHVSQRSSKLVK